MKNTILAMSQAVSPILGKTDVITADGVAHGGGAMNVQTAFIVTGDDVALKEGVATDGVTPGTIVDRDARTAVG